MQDYTLQDLRDAVRQAVADDKPPGSNQVTAVLVAELHEPVRGSWCTRTGLSCAVRTSQNPGTRPLSG